MRLLMLAHPGANRVYAAQAATMASSELAICAPGAGEVAARTLAGIDYLGFETDSLEGSDEERTQALRLIARQSTFLALFEERPDGLLRPIEVADPDVFEDDLVTIPKYPGKTNEQFTRLLLNVTLAAVECPLNERATVLDPLSGRGTTLTTAWTAGLNAAGVEVDEKAVEQMAAFLKTYLRRKRLKHKADTVPVRREGKSLGRKFEATVHLDDRDLTMGVFTGDTRSSAKLWGKRRFEAIVTDAPYGVVHGSRSDVVGTTGKRDRSPAGLLKGSLGVWAHQLRDGGALGLSWNTHGLSRGDLVAMVEETGLVVKNDGPWLGFEHRVDASIQRDVLVAVKPLGSDTAQ
ncbi:TRM11 family SAM-dependent methyltransferase [Raineyella fluvialis]|uniref:Site-specific DNA-methyltransferase n=1 Tax=Raineyella fluvialis TaxID=2662261 RepID=A0A5Q2FHT3_9ACTN|nr:site-specific DNA-methyltransferase [Raineyella fluvialis]QGF23916.1 site-specific DNA-methyltransferase [Raineyella fluvialis]